MVVFAKTAFLLNTSPQNIYPAIAIKYIVLYFFDVYFGPVSVDGFTESEMAVAAREAP